MWKEIRAKILEALEIRVRQVLGEVVQEETEQNKFLDKIIIDPTPEDRTSFVIDDNNYLSSMRYPFYQESRICIHTNKIGLFKCG